MFKQFLRFTRSINNPVLNLCDPYDQQAMKEILHEKFPRARTNRNEFLGVVCIAALGAISGKAEVMQAFANDLHHCGDISVVTATMKKWMRSNKKFFRGGQAHGPLKYADLDTALKNFLQKHLENIAKSVKKWIAAPNVLKRCKAVRGFMNAVKASASAWQAGEYYVKRLLEIIILAPLKLQEKDYDFGIDIWPLGPGTKDGLKLILPTARSKRDYHEGIRFLQRSLGRGQKGVSAASISAMLCHFKRTLTGTLDWSSTIH